MARRGDAFTPEEKRATLHITRRGPSATRHSRLAPRPCSPPRWGRSTCLRLPRGGGFLDHHDVHRASDGLHLAAFAAGWIAVVSDLAGARRLPGPTATRRAHSRQRDLPPRSGHAARDRTLGDDPHRHRRCPRGQTGPTAAARARPAPALGTSAATPLAITRTRRSRYSRRARTEPPFTATADPIHTPFTAAVEAWDKQRKAVRRERNDSHPSASPPRLPDLDVLHASRRRSFPRVARRRAASGDELRRRNGRR